MVSIRASLLIVVLLCPSLAHAMYYWASPSGSTSATCSAIDSTDPDVDPGSYGSIGAAARCATVAGDIVLVKAGTYTRSDDRINTANNGNVAAGQFVSGTSESVRTMVMGHPNGARPLIQHANGFYCTYGTVERHWITLKYLEINNGNSDGCGAGLVVNGQHVTFDDIILYNTGRSGISFSSNQNLDSSRAAFGRVVNSVIHDVIKNGTSGYCVYVQSTDVTIENSECYNSKGWGWHVYGGSNHPHRVTIRNTYVHDVLPGSQSFCAGLVAYGQGHKIYDNKIVITTASCPTATLSVGAITVRASGGTSEVHNNIIIQPRGHGLEIGTGVSTVSNRNNVFFSISGSAINNLSSGSVTSTNNAAVAAQSVGTSKVTISALTDCFLSTSDFRLKPGTNPCRNAGALVSTRPAPVGVTDIGNYEQGEIVLATVASGFIEATVNIGTPPVKPTAGIIGFSIVCGTCTGTPAVTAAIKPGSSNIPQLTVTGITGSGTATLSYNGSTGNMTGSSYVGPLSSAVYQGVNTVSGLAIAGTVDNSAGGSPPAGSLHIHHTVDEGSGTNLVDEVGANDSTISGAPTWTSESVSGSALAFTAGQDQRVTFAYGNAVDATAQSFSLCVWVKASAGMSNKIIAGPTIGASTRMYFGSNTGQTWQLGVGTSTYSATGQSEFSVTLAYQRLCLMNDATTDTVTLGVDGVRGTSAATVKSSAGITSLPGNFLMGCGFSGTSYCGGYTIDEPKIWTKHLSDAELLEDFQSYTPPGESVGGYAEVTHRCQLVYLDANGNPINYGAVGRSECEVVDGGGVAVEMLFQCTGGNCGPVALRPHATDELSNAGLVPQSLGALGIWMWGNSTDQRLNKGVSPCCLSGSFDAVNGVTILDSVASNTIELLEGEATQVRWILRCGPGSQNKVYSIKALQDNGAELDGAAGTTPIIRCVAPRVGTGF